MIGVWRRLAVDFRADGGDCGSFVRCIAAFPGPSGPVIEVAKLDTMGTAGGSDTNGAEILKQQWTKLTFRREPAEDAHR
jgi:hypothetical protein